VGRRLAGGAARQHPDLTSRAGIVLTLLAIDGVISAVVGALFLPIYIGTIPFPISAVLTGAVNLALVWAAAHWSDSLLLAGLPLWTFLAMVVVMTLGGPGGDLIFAGTGLYAFGAMIFLAVGSLPAVWFLRRRFH
jgi:hypothetical protein